MKIESSKVPNIVDIFSVLAFMSATVMALFSATYFQTTNTDLTQKTLTQVSMGLVGMSLMVFFAGSRAGSPVKYDDRIDRNESRQAVFIIIVGYAALSATTGIVLRAVPYLGLSAIDVTGEDFFLVVSFVMISAVVEEYLFRGAIYPFFERFFENLNIPLLSKTLSATVTAFIFMAFHLGVYGTSPDTLIVVFVNAVGMCVFYELSSSGKTRGSRLSVVICIHLVNNLISAGFVDIIGTDGLTYIAIIIAVVVVLTYFLDRRSKTKVGAFLAIYASLATALNVMIFLPILGYSGIPINMMTFVVIFLLSALFTILFVRRLQGMTYAEAGDIYD